MQKECLAITGLSGKKTLRGAISINGAKNAVLPMMASAILFNGPIEIDNVPDIDDVNKMSDLMKDLGATLNRRDRRMTIDATKIYKHILDDETSKKFRASIILTGPILGKIGKVFFPHPGGCVIGERPIDLFLSGFEKMGAQIREVGEQYELRAKGKRLRGADISFKIQSVTATETFVMAGILAEGKTVLRNCSLEPEVISMSEFLASAGAKITGIGTPTIEIEGSTVLEKPAKPYVTIPDRIETGSFLILGALSADNLEIKNCDPSHVSVLIANLKDAGVPISVSRDSIKISRNGKIPNSRFKAFNVKTHEYPGFPTDLQAPITTFLTQVSGESNIFETIFEGRLNYTSDLVKMGADIKMWDAHRASVKGPTMLKAKELEGPDIRAGLAFIIAGLVATGESKIYNVHFIDRGYEKIEDRLASIGAKIKRIKFTGN